MPQLSPALIDQISLLVATYIRAQRQNFLGRATGLSAVLRVQFNHFFRADVLSSVRVTELETERVANPSFYPMLQDLGFQNLPNFRTMGAITFYDVIVSQEPLTAPLLFHELVHVEQYRRLGIERFAELYVQGFLDGGGYEAIPLELNAYCLEGEFRQSPHRAFSVEERVSAWLREQDADETELGL